MRNKNPIGFVALCAILAALLTLVFVLELPKWIVWPMAGGYAGGAVGLIAYKYSQNWLVLFLASLAAGCLTKGSVSVTIALKAHMEQDGARKGVIDFLFTTSAVVDVALIIAGVVILGITVFVYFRDKYHQPPKQPPGFWEWFGGWTVWRPWKWFGGNGDSNTA